MPPHIPPDLFPRARQIILPLVATQDEREALLTEAFYLADPLLYGIERGGTAKVFAIRCIRNLLDYGCLPEGEHALARLLTTARYDCEADKHAEIKALVDIANALCIEEKPVPQLASKPIPAGVRLLRQTIATPRDERTPTVFISYSHQDEAFANQLINALNAAGHACWIDTNALKGGDDWIMAIAEGIINSYAFVVVVTLKALQSRWVQDEILWAKSKNKRIIPILMEDVLAHTRFFPLVSYQGVTVFDSDNATALAQLLTYLPSPVLAEVEAEVEDGEPDMLEPVAVAMPRSVPRALELAYLERLRLEELLNTEKYTAMGGTAQVQRKVEMRAVFELIKIGHSDEREQAEVRRFENAVDEIQVLRRCVLLGEPGGGKTTTLWKLAADLVTAALADRAAPIPLLIRLGKWTDAEQTLPGFIQSQIGDLDDYLDGLLAANRAALLLDGLNELPANQHKAKYPQVQRFIEQHPNALAVVSCRELDYTLDLGFDKIMITPLDPLRIREFVGRYLGTEQGDDLFWRLAGERATQQHHRFMEDMAEKLDDPERVFWIETQLPSSVHWDWGSSSPEYQNTYWREWLREREQPSSLVALARNPYMLLMLTSVYADEGQLPDNRGQLFAKFVDTLLEREVVSVVMGTDERDDLLNGLLGVAYKMQMRPNQPDEETKALTVLSKGETLEILDERQLYLAGSANILSVDEQVRFTHQLLQEYFAAKYIDMSIFGQNVRVRLLATNIWPPERWWERTNWEESVILLAGMYSDDPTPVVEWLMHTQPEMTAQCITRSGTNPPPDETLLRLRAAWTPRLTDLEHDPDPRARAAVGRALGQLTLSSGEPLDNRKGVSVILRDGIIRVPDIDWVLIPGGEFIYQDDQKLIIPSFEMSRYPITYTQFQAFIDDSEGFHDQRWWEGLAMPDGHNTIPGDQAFKFWNHPRERVSWYDAVAFCRWLSWRLGSGYNLNKIYEWAVRLPTEQEREKAARGTDGWGYPWGDGYQIGYANICEKSRSESAKDGRYYLEQTSAMGVYPQGKSPYGLLDITGNVWEWCLTDYNQPASRAEGENIGFSAQRVVRGGAWPNLVGLAHATLRTYYSPYARVNHIGFRVVHVPHTDLD